MRIGFNPQKDRLLQTDDFYHQVIIPVYIPHQEGYFKDSFQILQYCLESLFKTSHDKTYFTIVNNGSCKEVINYLDVLYNENRIHELIHSTSIGKLNAVLKGLAGHNFPLVTITDADVFFKNDWQKGTYSIFNAFPKAGAVSPVPSSKVLKQFTHNILAENFFSEKLKFTRILFPQALQDFAHSIGNPDFYNKHHLSYNLTITENTIRAIVGAAHFVATYRGSVFSKLAIKYTDYSLGGRSENMILDKPVMDQGYWRLSTEESFAAHMGNVTEPWMEESLLLLKANQEAALLPTLKQNKKPFFLNRIRQKLFFFLMGKKVFWVLFLRYKKLDKVMAENY